MTIVKLACGSATAATGASKMPSQHDTFSDWTGNINPVNTQPVCHSRSSDPAAPGTGPK